MAKENMMPYIYDKSFNRIAEIMIIFHSYGLRDIMLLVILSFVLLSPSSNTL